MGLRPALICEEELEEDDGGEGNRPRLHLAARGGVRPQEGDEIRDCNI